MKVVGYREKKEKNSVWQLNNLIKCTDLSIRYYKEYLNTGDRDAWEYYNIKSTLPWFGFALMIDQKLMPKKYDNILDRLATYAETQYKYSKYTPIPNHKNGEKVLEILYTTYKKTVDLFLMEVKRHGFFEDLKRLEGKELEEYIIKVTNYESDLDSPEFVSYFKKLVKRYINKADQNKLKSA